MVSFTSLPRLWIVLMPPRYMDRVMPWVHYVPVKVDLSDLVRTPPVFQLTLG